MKFGRITRDIDPVVTFGNKAVSYSVTNPRAMWPYPHTDTYRPYALVLYDHATLIVSIELVTHLTYALYASVQDGGHSGRPT